MIRLLLVDDHAILRDGLRALLSYYPDVEVVGEAEDGLQAIEAVESLTPDVILMDIAMPGMNGLEATHRIRQSHPESRILVLTQYDDKRYVLPFLRAGVSGYVVKRALGSDLINAVRAVAKGESFLYPSVASTVLEQLHLPRALAITVAAEKCQRHCCHDSRNANSRHMTGTRRRTDIRTSRRSPSSRTSPSASPRRRSCRGRRPAWS